MFILFFVQNFSTEIFWDNRLTLAKILNTIDVDARWLLTGEESNFIKKTNAEDVCPVKEAIYEERIKALKAVLSEKERIIRLYEKFVDKDENKILK